MIEQAAPALLPLPLPNTTKSPQPFDAMEANELHLKEDFTTQVSCDLEPQRYVCLHNQFCKHLYRATRDWEIYKAVEETLKNSKE